MKKFENSTPKYIIKLSKKLRKVMTPEEELLWLKLRAKRFNGLKFRRQHSIGRYIGDFYCEELRLIIEIDGGIHDYQNEYDENRNNFLSAGKFNILRFKNEEITNSIDDVLEKIEEYCV
jgi:very-short-patch-repair endonuclease